ncbi:armadillo-type protein [Chytriomyces cf. hyalinus JEL632]|nr:armadillo-type protein [Chytriomyces cf. hyalinus JEL632]
MLIGKHAFMPDLVLSMILNNEKLVDGSDSTAIRYALVLGEAVGRLVDKKWDLAHVASLKDKVATYFEKNLLLGQRKAPCPKTVLSSFDLFFKQFLTAEMLPKSALRVRRKINAAISRNSCCEFSNRSLNQLRLIFHNCFAKNLSIAYLNNMKSTNEAIRADAASLFETFASKSSNGDDLLKLADVVLKAFTARSPSPETRALCFSILTSVPAVTPAILGKSISALIPLTAKETSETSLLACFAALAAHSEAYLAASDSSILTQLVTFITSGLTDAKSSNFIRRSILGLLNKTSFEALSMRLAEKSLLGVCEACIKCLDKVQAGGTALLVDTGAKRENPILVEGYLAFQFVVGFAVWEVKSGKAVGVAKLVENKKAIGTYLSTSKTFFLNENFYGKLLTSKDDQLAFFPCLSLILTTESLYAMLPSASRQEKSLVASAWAHLMMTPSVNHEIRKKFFIVSQISAEWGLEPLSKKASNAISIAAAAEASAWGDDVEAALIAITLLVGVFPEVVLNKAMPSILESLDNAVVKNITLVDIAVWKGEEGIAVCNPQGKLKVAAVVEEDDEWPKTAEEKWERELKKELQLQLQKHRQRQLENLFLQKLPPQPKLKKELKNCSWRKKGQTVNRSKRFDCGCWRVVEMGWDVATLRLMGVEISPVGISEDPFRPLRVRSCFDEAADGRQGRLRCIESLVTRSLLVHLPIDLLSAITHWTYSKHQRKIRTELIIFASEILISHCGLVHVLIELLNTLPRLHGAREGLLTLCVSMEDSAAGEEDEDAETLDESEKLLKTMLATDEVDISNELLDALLSSEPMRMQHMPMPAGAADRVAAARVWAAKYDADEEIAAEAGRVWEMWNAESSLDANGIQGVVDLICDPCGEICAAAGKNLSAALSTLNNHTIPVMKQLFVLYEVKNVVPMPEYDDFGIVIPESLDKKDEWPARSGIALALQSCASVMKSENILNILFDFLIKNEALGDREESVRLEMLEAGIAAVNTDTCKSLVNPLLKTFTEYPAQPAGSSKTHDLIRESAVILLGTVAQHVDASDKKIPEVVDRLVETLKTPSEVVQMAVSECLPPLVSHVW